MNTPAVETEVQKSTPAPKSEKDKKREEIQAKAKAKAQKAAKKAAATKDKFGFPEGSKESIAIGMYANGGATSQQIKEKLGATHLNCLNKVKERGHDVTKEKVKSSTGREVFKYTVKYNDKAGQPTK